jgi:hypothetical protein
VSCAGPAVAGADAPPLDADRLETGDGLGEAAVPELAAPGEQPAVTTTAATATAHVTAVRSRHRGRSQSIQ